MKNLLYMVCFVSCLYSGNANAKHHSRIPPQITNDFIEMDSITKNSYTLVFVNCDTVFARSGAAVRQRMVDAFFKVYPQEAAVFNKKAAHRVVFLIDPKYDGVAESSDNRVRFSASWMLRKPTDIDVVTHEVMHIVQEYGYGAGPGWLTEGIADYARYKFGVDNAGADWNLPVYQNGNNYTDSYRVTARFLVWIEGNVSRGIVERIDAMLRAHTYTGDRWRQLTGRTLDELWKSYAANPVI